MHLNLLPANRFTAPQRHDFRVTCQEFGGQRPRFAPQRHRFLVARQTVEIGAEEARESFQLVERAGFFEGFGVELDARAARCSSRRSRTRAPSALRMRRAVRAEEKARVAAGRRLDQRHAMRLALQHRQAVVVRPDAAAENRVAVVSRWCAVIVAADRAARPRARTRRASFVVMCSNTIFSSGKSRRSGVITRSMNTASRSNKSIAGRSLRRAPAAACRVSCITSSVL